ncbi:hypothetical protein G6F56_010291 [Rhizopus delemar]|nr:hypothetical protein G6F56_010291 [Rhizopus delemar]
MLIRLASVMSATFILISCVNASGQIIQIVDESSFCTFLPPKDETDRNISDSETEANAFCIGSTPLALGAEKLSSGFILSAHYVKTDNYVQITGLMNPALENLISTDEGGQYDIKAPNGASCAGWDYFVNLVEPAGNDYCIRCCNNDSDCNRGISEQGCERIVPGDYSGSSNSITSGISTASTTSSSTSISSIISVPTTSSFTTSSSSLSSSATTSVSSSASSSIYVSSSSSYSSITYSSLKPSTSSSLQPSTPAAQGSNTAQSTSNANFVNPGVFSLIVCLLLSITNF